MTAPLPVLVVMTGWLTVLGAVSLTVAPVYAQAPSPLDDPLSQPDNGDDEDDPEKKEFTPQDCAKLPGGNAPINRLARLEGKLSVRNLELTYFGKTLALLTAQDFDVLRRLIPFCQDTSSAVADLLVNRLSELVSEAQATRAETIEWIKQKIAEVDAMEPTPQSIETIHNYWAEMLNRQFEMTPGDLRYLADYLDRKRNEFYAEAGRVRTPTDMFVPSPTESRDGQSPSG